MGTDCMLIGKKVQFKTDKGEHLIGVVRDKFLGGGSMNFDFYKIEVNDGILINVLCEYVYQILEV